MTLKKEIEEIAVKSQLYGHKFTADQICQLIEEHTFVTTDQIEELYVRKSWVKERIEKQIQCILCDMQESMAKDYHEKKLYELLTELSGEK
ncbi:MAG: hypothetical protein U9O94_01565 [Nanoarchaeota archaeon]|nr:hypothetical protein [Nanoarchaeota archaeon]